MARSGERIKRHAAVSTALGLLSDRELEARLDSAPLVSDGIGGAAVRLDVDGIPVFAKRTPATELELRKEHRRSTANIFDVPPYCHYGLGVLGGGTVWRELAAHVMTTNWVLEGRNPHFPLLHHWRVLSLPGRLSSEDREADVAFWGGSAQVRERLEQLEDARDSVVLFCEYFPMNLHDWLYDRIADGTIDDVVEDVETQVVESVLAMNRDGLLHCDTHFRNFVTDGTRIHIADFGLATSDRFTLSADERAFCDLNRTHDGCYVVTHLVNWLVHALAEQDGRIAYIRRVAEGHAADPLPPKTRVIVERYAPIAAVLNNFYAKLRDEDRAVPFPAAELAKACAATGFQPGCHGIAELSGHRPT
ncbi:protein kinase family protein [Nocardia sp. CA2R105]|uniref:protein kinase family protein n=1 Tax=Nocardia coffeae TaxID=2873381 RepID=UPI001CA766EA|nr:protein kinase family protein [Nocardia coffeae]MBY8863901.1 protein kinase family protein [Nocardia coffeae]